MDDSVSAFFVSLRDLGVMADTLVIVTSPESHAIALSEDEQNDLFANGDRRQLKAKVDTDWSDNLIGVFQPSRSAPLIRLASCRM